MQRQRKHHLQQRSSRECRACSNSRRHSPESQSVLDRAPRATPAPGADGRLPSPAPSAVRTMDIEMSSDCCNINGSSKDILPTLVEITFRPYYPHCCSVIRDGCDLYISKDSELRLVQTLRLPTRYHIVTRGFRPTFKTAKDMLVEGKIRVTRQGCLLCKLPFCTNCFLEFHQF